MKFFHLLIVIVAAIAEVNAQVTITQSDMPQPGETFISTNLVNDLTIDPLETGEDHTWNFQQLIPLTSVTDTFSDQSGLPLLYQLLFSGANLADKTGYAISIDQFTLDNVFLVYKNTSGAYEQLGFAGTLGGIPVPVIYEENDVIYHFPLQFGAVDSSQSDFSLGLTGVGYVSRQRKRINTADGWGTVTTPAGSFDVLRVTAAITDVDSVYLDTLNYGTKVTLKSYEYKWLAKESGIPVFQVNAQEVLGVPVITQIFYQDTVLHTGIHELQNSTANLVDVYPNPAGKWLQLQINEPLAKPMAVVITGMTGQVILQRNIQQAATFIDVSDWSNGIYFLNVVKNGSVSSTKFVVQH
ncbi:MAG TPA: T9SS type A sorting domain-containing protein [Chitinophagales bacterium]|nr:T9SS type A sorting domain-containing protein [Chitinophagales bacterium]